MVDDNWLKNVIIPRYGASLKQKKNVAGWSRTFKPKLREGQPPGEPCFRVYVFNKVDVSALAAIDVIPKSLDGVLTDVVAIGVPYSPPKWNVKPMNATGSAAATDRQSAVRPVPLGVGVGNWDITQGSLGMLYTPIGSTKILAGSNAHIVSPSPFLHPSEVIEKRILQPGAYAHGKDPANVVGSYVWHKELAVSGSEKWTPVNQWGMLIWRIVQFIAQLLNRGSAPKVAVPASNLIAFGVYEPTIPHVKNTVDAALGDEPFIGHLFAASDFVGMVCKVEHIIDQGYAPVIPWAKVQDGDRVKGSSFWGDYETTVMDASASVLVNYGDYYAPFDDAIFLINDGTIRGGWSGSGFRLIKKP